MYICMCLLENKWINLKLLKTHGYGIPETGKVYLTVVFGGYIIGI